MAESIAPPIAEAPAAELLARAFAAHGSGDFTAGKRLYEAVLDCDHGPARPLALHNLALIEHAAGRTDEAIGYLESAVALAPGWADAYSNLAAMLRATGRLDAAFTSAQQAIALRPDHAAAYSNLGAICEDRGATEAALAAYLRACELDPDLLDAHLNAIQLLRKEKRFEEALLICNALIRKFPDNARLYCIKGDVLHGLWRPREALEAYRRAATLAPDLVEAHHNLGITLYFQGAFAEAIDAFQQALARDPNNAEALCNLGAAHESLNQIELSMAAYRQAIARNPSLLGARLQVYHQRRSACDWETLAQEEAAIAAAIADYQKPIPAFQPLAMDLSPELHLRCAQLWAGGFSAKPSFPHNPPPPGSRPRKLKIGYLSADFYTHATAFLIAELLELHDRTQFEIIAYSYGNDDGSPMRQRLVSACDGFVDIKDVDDRAAAQRIFDDGIDILVELKGYTQFARSNIAAQRPAPVQVNFLGYPGTMGADFIDYIIADPIVLPQEEQSYYVEKIVHLPECYQPNDRHRQVADRRPTRAACGLPETGFVFCCFNNSYKITPEIFAVWMRLLREIDGSVLWLLDAFPGAKANLVREAIGHGVDPARLVFAPKIPAAEHLARLQIADLFLDTLPYNAHTTASEALWVGLPVLTIRGSSFAGRVAASLLHAIGLPELVTNSMTAYAERALELARRPEELAGLKRKLLANRATCPLFDTGRFARHLETAYRRMWDLWAAGEAPQPFSVSPIPHAQQAHESATRADLRQKFTSCPLCDSGDAAMFVEADCSAHPGFESESPTKLTWLRCKACDHIFAESYFYSRPTTVEDTTPLGHDIEAGRQRAAKIVSRIARHRPSGAWLDIGVGDGSLLFTAAEWGFYAQALDRDARKVAVLQQLGFAAQAGAIETWPAAQAYDVISLVDGLQRSPFPKRTLAMIRAHLREDGLLFLALPNKDALAFALLHASGSNPYWSESADCHMFGRERLYALLRQEGFEPIDFQVSERYRVGMEIIARKVG